MPTAKASKTINKPAATDQPVLKTIKSEPVQSPEPERQSQFATILIGLLIIASGLLVYNYFQSVNSPSTTTVDQNKQSSTPTPSTTPTPVIARNQTNQPTGQGNYTVQAGDSLWSVAQKVYGDGFKWDKIAQANQLQKDSVGRPVIEVGQVLTVPDSAASINQPAGSSVATNPSPTPTPTLDRQVAGASANTVAAQTYTIKHGDSLWSIAQAVYGNGASWILIFNDSHNHLGTLPNGRPLIHAGNQLYLPAAP
jgi:nucleoid-associated protein YgaU